MIYSVGGKFMANKSDRAAEAAKINILLRNMTTADQRIDFISECMKGICNHCGDILDGRTCYCTCDD